MRYEVVMPQLGMAQDTGVVVAWLKVQGDRVADDDILMEVETDKATVEVPAGQSGLVAEIRAEPGKEVPVGETVAVITVEGEAVSKPAANPEGASSEPGGGGDARSAGPKPTPQDRDRCKASAVSLGPRSSGAVLASPKARALARRFNVDLRDLVRRGIAEPVRAADIEASIARAPQFGSESTLSTCIDCAAFDELLELAEGDGIAISRTLVLAAFAAGSLRATGKSRDSVLVASRTFGEDGASVLLLDADRKGLRNLGGESSISGDPDLSVIDLAGTRFSEHLPAGRRTPALTVARTTAGSYSLALRFLDSELPVAHAAAFLDNLALRISNPMRHLL